MTPSRPPAADVQCRILVVDDEPRLRQLLESLLVGRGYDVVLVANGRQATAEFELRAPDLVLTDIKMPGMDGLQLTEWIKRRAPETDVIIMTGFGSTETIVKALRLGAFDYLLKPFGDIELVATTVARALEKRRLAADLRQRSNDLLVANQQLEQLVAGERTRSRQLEEAYQRLRQTHGQLRDAEASKMEAVATLAGGVAHDFNNRLLVINGYSELLLEQIGSDASLRSKVEKIYSAGKQAALLTRQLLALGRRQVAQPSVLDLNTVVANFIERSPPEVGDNIELATRFTDGLAKVKLDPDQVEQVLMNLVRNALDAMPQGGRILIETRNVRILPGDSEERLEAEPGSYVQVVVSDTGKGMDESTKARVLEPFFTTKQKGEAMGLGLCAAYGVVKQMGGALVIDSAPNEGTSLRIYFPAIEQEQPPLVIQAPKVPASGGAETVLLVEDEDFPRQLLREALEGSGYAVLVAGHGAEALKVADSHDGQIHLVVTDVVMPKMGGPELVEQLARKRPETKALFISGYTEDYSALRSRVAASAVHFLAKPFGPGALKRKVREVLDAAEDSVG